MTTSEKTSNSEVKLFAGNMWPVFTFADANTRYQKFLNTSHPAFQHLLDGVLIHDRIVVPTQDFLSVTALVGVLGVDAVNALLAGGCLSFLRLRGGIAYY